MSWLHGSRSPDPSRAGDLFVFLGGLALGAALAGAALPGPARAKCEACGVRETVQLREWTGAPVPDTAALTASGWGRQFDITLFAGEHDRDSGEPADTLNLHSELHDAP